MDKILERIQVVIHKVAQSRILFCSETGINQIHLKQIFRKKRNIGYEEIYYICQAYPQLNSSWLITGKGKIRNSDHIIDPNLIRVNIRISKGQKVSLIIERRSEYYYRQTGIMICNKIEEYQCKYGLSESKSLYFLGYSYAKKLSVDNQIAAYQLYRSIYSLYSAKTATKQLNSVIAFHLAYKYYCTTINTTN